MSLATTGNARSRQTLAQIFLDNMQSVTEADHLPCPLVVHSTLSILSGGIQGYATPPLKRSLVKRYPDVLSVCARFLMRPRTTTDRQSLCAPGLNPCTCDLSTPFLHELHDPESFDMAPRVSAQDQPLAVILDAQMRFLTGVMDSSGDMLWKKLRRIENTTRSGEYLPWPRGPQDLVPYGIDASIDNLCQWSECYIRPELLALSCAVYTMTARYASPSTLFCHLLPILPSTITTVLSILETDPPDLDIVTKCIRELAYGINVLILACVRISRHTFHACMARQPSSAWEPLLDVCVRAYWAVHARDRLDAQFRGQFEETFLLAAARLQTYLGLPEDTQRYPAALARVGLQWSMEPDVYRTLVMSFSENMFRGHVCAQRTCARTYLSEGHIFETCKGCKHVFYCSRQCQKTAWRDGEAPHRDVCATINTVMAVAKRRSGAEPCIDDDFRNKCAVAGVEEELVQKVVDYLVKIYTR